MSVLSLGKRHPVKGGGLDPVANAFAGTVTTHAISMREYAVVEYEIIKGVGATGTATITVEACDDAASSNPVAIPFKYQVYAGSDDLPGAIIAAPAAGFNTTAGSSQRYFIQADSQSLGNKGWVRLKSVEVVVSAVLGGIEARLEGARFATDIPNTVLS